VALLRRLLEQATRDLRSALSRPAPTVARPTQRRTRPSSGATATARDLIVREVRRETADALTLVLADPGGAPIAFRPGQFFTLLVDVGGETVRRAYSACSSHLDPSQVAITVKRVDGGRVSSHLHATAAPGLQLRVLGPSGDFGLAPDASAARHVLLIGGGSGITPLMSIARGVLDVEPQSTVTLVYGNRRDDDVIFARELDAMASDRFRVVHVLEEPAPRAAHTGRLDEATCRAVLADVAAPDRVFVCGPEPMMDAARAALVARGVDPAIIAIERFATVRAARVAHTAQPVTIELRGTTRTITVEPGATVLDAAIDAGLAMPFSCAMGGCGACAVELRSGALDLDEPNCLTPDERARGKVLTCVARPLGPCTLAVPR
jgi:ferredoxin-NADP reductase